MWVVASISKVSEQAEATRALSRRSSTALWACLGEIDRRVLELVAGGLTSKEIARRLFLSRQAVAYHIASMFNKLGAETRAGLVGRAYALGVLRPGRWPPEFEPDLRG
jgi:DNA-binding CsgD family transcriptional regulator